MDAVSYVFFFFPGMLLVLYAGTVEAHLAWLDEAYGLRGRVQLPDDREDRRPPGVEIGLRHAERCRRPGEPAQVRLQGLWGAMPGRDWP